ncbi:phage tail tape measure protein, TP901 family [Xylanimonas cellulosilytica DSM 15894]|uniref:Phage tail tape measure protein, TP901 family n=1 Tax=Xylanimonas cellulosilytica (strain DSM 15894 / JCM 12276 / CECT 5975 / KCTC 9989 / LMG 20990 / NBRC 107835 / XIL07) TaxID=446471 RepID=D1BW58_XYLCX|nr:phage tail tape measure protein [Xylanimonas cellulosilytica]ACZ29561.1 phage tail tape measure protein, TP901 family [Xylanimonas cellulosilytica DSM 15894]
MTTRSYAVRLDAEYQALVRGFDEGAKAADKMADTVEKAGQRVERAQKAQADAAGRARVAEQQLAQAREKGAADSAQVVGAEERAAKARRDLDKATKDVTQAEAAHRSAQAAHTQATARQTTAVGKLTSTLDNNREAFNRAGTALAAFGAVTTATVGATVAAAVQWESAWTGVTKTLPDDADLKATEDGLRSLAKTLPATHQEIAAVAEAAGQLGVSAQALLPFTKTMIDLGETTNLTADEAATSIAQLANVMGVDLANEVDNLGASLVALGNNGASTERDIVQMAQRIAGAGAIVGLSTGEVMGLANALASVGIEVEAGGSAISNVLTDIAKDVASGSEDVANWARVAGMSAQDFAAAWNADPTDALASFIEGLGRMNEAGEDVFTTLSDLGQSDVRVSRALLSMATSGDMLRKSIQMGNDAWADNTALLEEAGKRYDTTEAKIQIARNSINDAAITVGSAFLPVLAQGAEAVAGLANAFSELPEPVQQAIGGLGGIVGAAALVAGGFLLVVPRVVDTVRAFRQLREISPGVATGLGKVGKAATAAGVALVALEVLDTIGSMSERAAAGIEQTTAALLDNAASVDALFAAVDAGRNEGAWDWGRLFSSRTDQATEINTLADAIDRLVNPSVTQKMGDWAETVPLLGKIVSVNDGKNASAQITALGESLAYLVQSGHADLAADRFADISAQWTDAGGSLDDLNALMPAYGDALTAVDSEQKLAAESAEDMSEATSQVAEMTEEAAAALQKWREMVAGAHVSFRDLGGAWQAAIDQQREYAEQTAKATKSSKDSWEDYYDGVSVSADQWIEQLQKQAEAQARWRDNVLKASEQVREELPANMTAAADAMIDDLIARGPEGAEMLEAFVTAKPEQRARIVETWTSMGEDIVHDLENIRTPQITVEANTRLAVEQTNDLLGVIDSARGTVTLLGNGAPVVAELGAVTATVDAASGTVTIYGEDGEALTTLSDYTATIDATDGTVQITGNDENGRNVVVGLTDWVTQQGASITVDASTTEATLAVNAWREAMAARSVTIQVRANMPDLNGTASGNGRMGSYSSGGHTGAGGKWEPAGVVHKGEFVIRQESTRAIDAAYPGLLDAMNSGGLTAFGLGGFASGGYTFGAPSTKGKDAAYWRDAFMDFPERYRLLEQIWKMQTDLADKTGLARQAAEQEISRAETKLSEAEYAATVANGDPRYWDGVVAAQAEAKKKDEAAQAEAKKKDEAAQESAARRADTARDIGTSMRRGEYVSQATSGLSGAYGLVDTLYAQSRNTDLSASSQKSLAGAAAAAEGQFTSLYAQLDKVNAAVDEQSDLVGDLQRAYDQVKNAISGAFDLQGVARQQDQLVSAAQSAREKADALKNDVVYEAHTNEQGETYYTSRLSDEAVQAEKDAQAAEKAAAGAGTGASYLKAAQEYAGKVQTLAGKIQALVKRGVPTRIIQEILAFGVDGGAIDAATAIGSLSDADLGKLSTAYQQIDAYSGQIGQYTTATMAAGGLAGQSSVLTGLQGQASGLEAQIAGVGKAVEDAIATAFGLPKRAAGGPTVPGQTYWVGERGPELWTSAAAGFVLDAATSRNLAMATPAGGYGAGRYGQAAPQVTKTYSATVNTLQATPAQVLAAVKQAELQDVMP